jgi:tRNA A-37 threonylcarbamoyl transferase component Bud32
MENREENREFAMQCPTCKAHLEDGVRFCPHDGTPLVDTGTGNKEATAAGLRRSTTRDIELPVVIGSRYRLEERRGGGGMATVYRATDLTLDRVVAVKLINPELRNEPEFDARFQREARIASQLADPHIVVVHDFGLDPTFGPFLVMEYLQGQSLRERLHSQGPLPLKAGLQLNAQILLALIHAHGRGIIHRDIKPDNIFLLNQSGVRLHTRVLDFGIARIYRREDAGQVETITHAGAVLGTPRYMSPEQLAGQPVDVRSDIYSAALVMHEALTGHLPYVSGKSLVELCPDATAALQDLIYQCLRPNPAERPQTTVEVYLRLQELGKASGVLLLPPGALDKLVAARKGDQLTVAYQPAGSPWWRRRAFLLGGAALIGLAGAGGLGWYLWGGARQPTTDSLLDVRLGDWAEDVVHRLELIERWTGNPWRAKPTQTLLGPLVREGDLNLEDADLDKLESYRTRDERVCVLFHHNRVRAIVARNRVGSTGRGVKLRGDVGTLYRLYDEKADTTEIETPDGRSEIRRYPELGMAFEIRKGQVTAAALYPGS